MSNYCKALTKVLDSQTIQAEEGILDSNVFSTMKHQASRVQVRLNSLKQGLGWGSVARGVRCHANAAVAMGRVVLECTQREEAWFLIFVLRETSGGPSDGSKLEPDTWVE